MPSNLAEFEQYADRINSELAEPWEAPMPFNDENELPDFPLDALPAPLAHYAEALAVSTQVAPSMTGAAALGILSMLFQKNFALEVNTSYSEVLCLYVLIVAPPASRKSAAVTAITRPVLEWEKTLQMLQRGDIARSEAEQKLLEDSLTIKRKAAANGDTEAEQEMYQLSEKLAQTAEKHAFRMLVSDATTEALEVAMYQQGGAISVVSAEGGGLFDMAGGKYSRTADISVYLCGHDGDLLDCNRITRKGFMIDNPRLSMLLAVQPQVLKSAMGNDVFTGRGLIARFLFVMCPQKFRNRLTNPPPMPDDAQAGYNRFIADAIGHTVADAVPGTAIYSGIIRLSSEAEAMRQAYSHEIDCKLDDVWSGNFSAWAGKLCGTTCRIAALLHIGDAVAAGQNPCDVPVSASCMERAMRIAEALTAHAEEAYRTGGADVQAGARFLWNAIQRTGEKEITKRLLHQKVRSARYPKAVDMDEDLEALESMGYIRVETVLREGRGRKPSDIIRVNPQAMK